MLKLKLQYFGHLIRTANSLEKSLMLGKIEGRRRRGQQRMRWSLDIHFVVYSVQQLQKVRTIFSTLKSRDITLPTKVRLVKAMVFLLVMYGCESWTIKKAEQRRIDAFELWCWSKTLENPLDCKEIQPVHPKRLQSYPTLCDPWDGSPPGLPVPGILQARTLEWVAISFSNVWKWKRRVKKLS